MMIPSTLKYTKLTYDQLVKGPANKMRWICQEFYVLYKYLPCDCSACRIRTPFSKIYQS